MNLFKRAYKSFNYRTKSLQYSIARRLVNLEESNNYYIFSEPRGGSTWIAEIIQHAVNKPIFWEPFENRVKEIQKAGFAERQYLLPNTYAPEIKTLVSKAFKGKFLSEWTTIRSSIKEMTFSDTAIFKVCRGNGFLPWILNNYTFNNLPVYLVRNPLAVVSSQLRHRGWKNGYRSVIIPSNGYNDIYKTHYQFLSSLHKKEMVLAAYWCIGNRDLLTSEFDSMIIKVYYEDVLRQPEQFLNRIKKEWSLDFNICEVMQTIRTPSKTASKDLSSDESAQLNKWENNLTNIQINNVLDVCNYFKIDLSKWDIAVQNK